MFINLPAVHHEACNMPNAASGPVYFGILGFAWGLILNTCMLGVIDGNTGS